MVQEYSAYENAAMEYDALMSTLELKVLSGVIDELAAFQGDTPISVIDFCCGTGLIAEMINGRPGIDYVGIDMDADFLAAARKKMRGRENFRFIESDVLTYRSEKPFDVALITFGYHHIEDPCKEMFLKHVYGLLKHKGICIVGDYIIPSYEEEQGYRAANTEFYARRIAYLKKHGLVSAEYLESFKEFCAYSADHKEFKVDYRHFLELFEKTGFLKEKEIKTWPHDHTFNNDRVGDYIFVFRKK